MLLRYTIGQKLGTSERELLRINYKCIILQIKLELHCNINVKIARRYYLQEM